MIKAVCFDFDGTLVNSNTIKKNTFLFLAARFERGEVFIEHLLHKNPPLDRHAVFSQLAKKYDLPEEQKRELVTEFNALVHEKIVGADLMPGAISCLKKLSTTRTALSINSATPERELIAVLRDRCMLHWFKEILGRPNSKLANLEKIMSNQRLAPHEVLVVGDGADDHDYAKQAGCHFQPVFDFRGPSGAADKTLRDLAQLDPHSFFPQL